MADDKENVGNAAPPGPVAAAGGCPAVASGDADAEKKAQVEALRKMMLGLCYILLIFNVCHVQNTK